jgi:hypothetical protein
VGSNGQDSWFREIFQTSTDEIIHLTLNNKDYRGTQLVQYFFSDSQLIYVNQTHTDLNQIKTIDRLYLNNGRLIKWIEPAGTLKDNKTGEFLKSDIDLADYANELIKDFSNQ